MISSQDKGFSLLEVLVAFSILGIAFIGLTYFYQNSARSKKHIRLQAVQEALAHDIRTKLQTASSLYASLLDPANGPLTECVLGVGSGCTAAMTTAPQKANSPQNLFILHHPVGVTTSEVISSIYYSDIGARDCDPNAPNCIFQVSTFFYALCPFGADSTSVHPDTCKTGAEEIEVGFSVVQVQAETGQPMLPNLPRLPQLFPLQVADILGVKQNGSCNPGAVANGYTQSGTMSCACKVPYITSTQFPSNRNGPVCSELAAEALSCPTGLIYEGLDANGMPICKTFADAYDCETISGSEFAASNGTCPDGYWLQMYMRGTCTFNCVVDSSGGSCNSWETAAGTDTRAIGGYAHEVLNTSSWNAQELNMVQQIAEPGLRVSSASSLDVWVQQGMVCSDGSMSCCKQN